MTVSIVSVFLAGSLILLIKKSSFIIYRLIAPHIQRGCEFSIGGDFVIKKIAVCPNGFYLAITTSYKDTLYVYDLSALQVPIFSYAQHVFDMYFMTDHILAYHVRGDFPRIHLIDVNRRFRLKQDNPAGNNYFLFETCELLTSSQDLSDDLMIGFKYPLATRLITLTGCTLIVTQDGLFLFDGCHLQLRASYVSLCEFQRGVVIKEIEDVGLFVIQNGRRPKVYFIREDIYRRGCIGCGIDVHLIYRLH